MKEEELIQLGFKKKKSGNDYWYELRYRKHIFLTNDTIRNNRKDKWFIGYCPSKTEDTFWFNDNLKEQGMFPIIFHLLTGKEFKLAHQQKLIKILDRIQEFEEWQDTNT